MSYLMSALVVAVVALAAVFYVRRYLAYRGARLVECPENHQAASVKVSSAWAALGGSWRLADCTRWPEKHACGRECLAEIEQSPEDCLVRRIVTQWYEDKSCVVCGRALGQVDWYDRKPGLMDAEGAARTWPEVAPEQLPEVLATHRPVCFDCYVAETFRRAHPELVLDNPWMPASRAAK